MFYTSEIRKKLVLPSLCCAALVLLYKGLFSLPFHQMGGQGNFQLAVPGSAEAKAKEKVKVSGLCGKQTRKKKKVGSKTLCGSKRSADTVAANRNRPLFRKRRRSSSCEELEDNENLGVHEKGKYPLSVIKPEDWSTATRELRPRKQQQALGDIMIRKDDAGRIIGRKIKVFWPLDDDWYSGTVESFDRSRKRHHIVYDDGDEEWLELARERFKIQLYPDDNFRNAGSLVRSDKLGVRHTDKTNQTRRKSKEGKRRRGRRIGKICSTGKEKAISPMVMDHKEAAKMLSLKKTAPRSRTARIAKQYVQKQFGKNFTEDVNFEVVSAKDTHLLDIKQQDAQNDGEGDTGIDVKFCNVDDTDSSRREKMQNCNQFEDSLGKETYLQREKFYILQTGKPAEHADEKDYAISAKVDEMKSEKQSKQMRELDANESIAVHTNQLEKNQTVEMDFSNQGCQFADKTSLESRPNLSHQFKEMKPIVGGIDEKVIGKQTYGSVSIESVNEKKESSDLVNMPGKSQGIKVNVDEKQPYGISSDEKVSENLASWDLGNVLGNKHGIRRQRSIMKIRLRDSISANGSLSTPNREGYTVNSQSLQSSPSWEGFFAHRQSKIE